MEHTTKNRLLALATIAMGSALVTSTAAANEAPAVNDVSSISLGDGDKSCGSGSCGDNKKDAKKDDKKKDGKKDKKKKKKKKDKGDSACGEGSCG